MLPTSFYFAGVLHANLDACRQWLRALERRRFAEILDEWNGDSRRESRLTELNSLLTEERDRRMKELGQTRETFVKAVSIRGSVHANYAEICNEAIRERNRLEKISAGPSPKQFWRYVTMDAYQQQIVESSESKFNKPTPREWVNSQVTDWVAWKVRELLRNDYGHWRSGGTINNPTRDFVEDHWFPEGRISDSPALNEAVAQWVGQICEDILR
jgi:hypothetical protein